jgi:hypothetical protein
MENVENFGYTPEDQFRADSEIIDALKMEASALNEKDATLIKGYVGEVKEALLLQFGKYISNSKKDEVVNKLDGIQNRILMVEDSKFNDFIENWLPNEKSVTPGIIQNKTARYFSIGDFIVLSEFNEYPTWIIDNLSPSSRQMLMDSLGNKEKAVEFMKDITMHQAIAHEVGHSFQDPETYNIYSGENIKQKLAFIECGAGYYESKILEKLGRQALFDSGHQAGINFYEDLVKNYGEIVHEIFFGKNIQQHRELKAELLGKFTDELVEGFGTPM